MLLKKKVSVIGVDEKLKYYKDKDFSKTKKRHFYKWKNLAYLENQYLTSEFGHSST